MIVKENFNLSFDLSGNMLLTIPKSYLQNADQETLLKSVEGLIRSAIKKINFSSDWNGDSAADVVEICESSANTKQYL
ncbi:MAG: hypothetical protein ACTFAL_15585 [Candidatus Electronema sp. V4]|uniref:hypothetical protein n=1 Tax=Candidatus Electronema sp. V4 TaxID=3454756 RepID=UPI0040559031